MNKSRIQRGFRGKDQRNTWIDLYIRDPRFNISSKILSTIHQIIRGSSTYNNAHGKHNYEDVENKEDHRKGSCGSELFAIFSSISSFQ